eukprot:Pgem_evm1s15276
MDGASQDLLEFENVVYLRLPGYGTSYISGKLLIDELIKDYKMQKENKKEHFQFRQFFDDFNSVGMIPLSLIRRKLLSKN